MMTFGVFIQIWMLGSYNYNQSDFVKFLKDYSSVNLKNIYKHPSITKKNAISIFRKLISHSCKLKALTSCTLKQTISIGAHHVKRQLKSDHQHYRN